MLESVRPVTLKGQHVLLQPLSQDHAQGLFNRGRNVADWAYMPRGCFVDMADTRQWIDEAVSRSDELAFALVETAKNRAVGSTRFLNIRDEHKGLEIGWTWLGPEWQRTPINTEAKLLLLTHAFEKMGRIGVELKTDSRNIRSQRAMERIGARREGIRRQHMIVQDNYLRDSVYYSILDQEWPEVKARLTSILQRN